MKGAHSSQRNIIHRIRRTCDKYNIHFSDYICDSLYMNKIKHNIKKYQEMGLLIVYILFSEMHVLSLYQ